MEYVLVGLWVAVFVFGLLFDNGFIRKTAQVPVKLTLRKLRRPGGDLLGGGRSGENMFAAELNLLFIHVTDILDFAVSECASHFSDPSTITITNSAVKYGARLAGCDASSDTPVSCTGYPFAVDDDLPILAQQEYGHGECCASTSDGAEVHLSCTRCPFSARMHREASAALHKADPGTRFKPLIWALDCLLLRLGRSVGMAMT